MILAADNLQIFNPRVAEALEKQDPRPLQELARRCQQAGAAMLDLNPGFLSKRREDRLAFMVDAVQDAVDRWGEPASLDRGQELFTAYWEKKRSSGLITERLYLTFDNGKKLLRAYRYSQKPLE